MSANKLVLGQDGLVVGNNQLVVSGDGISTGSVATKKLGVSNGVTITGGVYANGSLGTDGQVLTSNGTDVYWGVVAASGGGVNVDEQYIWTNTHTFQNTVTINSTLGVGNTSVSGFVNATSSVNALSVTVGTSFIANATTLVTGPQVTIVGGGPAGEGGQITLGYGNNLATAITGQTGNTWNIDVTGGTLAFTPLLRVFNQNGDASITAGFNIANTGRMHVGSLLEQTDSTFKVSGTVNATTSVNSALLSVGTSFIANTLGAYHTGIVNAASHTTTGVTANVTGVYPASNSTGTALGSATQRWVINGNTLNLSGVLTTTSGINANGTVGTAGQILTSNGTVAYWGPVVVNTSEQYIWTNVHTFTNTVSFGNSTSNVEISAAQFSFNNVFVEANGSFGTAGQILTSNSTGVYWGSSTAGSGTGNGADTTFFINGQTVNTAFTTSATLNYHSAGPITLNANVTITTGSRWSIV